MQYCYRYWAWTMDIRANEAELMHDLALWHCVVEHGTDSINIWVPEQSDTLLRIKYPALRRHPIFDRY